MLVRMFVFIVVFIETSSKVIHVRSLNPGPGIAAARAGQHG